MTKGDRSAGGQRAFIADQCSLLGLRKSTSPLRQVHLRNTSAKAFSFSKIDFDILSGQLSISSSAPLVRRGNHADRVAESVAQGGEAYMTSAEMYRHLNMLENLIPKPNEAGCRLWIDTLFFRVSAMLSGSKSMSLNIQQRVPPDAAHRKHPPKISGTIDYAAFTMDPCNHETFIQSTSLQYIKHQNPNGLFITEAKRGGVPLADQVPQAVSEMYASAKHLMKGILRGAITDGHEWMFLILYLNKNGIGGIYSTSPIFKIQISATYPFQVLSPEPDIIAGIIAHWVEHSFVNLDENDWLSPQ